MHRQNKRLPGLGIARDLLEPAPRSRRVEKAAASGGRGEAGYPGVLLSAELFIWELGEEMRRGSRMTCPECKESVAS